MRSKITVSSNVIEHYTILMALSMCSLDIVFFTRSAVKRTAGFACQHSTMSLLKANRIWNKKKDKSRNLVSPADRESFERKQLRFCLLDHFPIAPVLPGVAVSRKLLAAYLRSPDRSGQRHGKARRMALP